MDSKKLEELFGKSNENGLDILIKDLKILNEELQDKYNFEYPFFKGDYNINFYDYIKNKKLNNEGISTEECMKYISNLYQNIPNWKNPGTMINIIPPVNLASLAASSMSSMYNANFAQDTYAGYLIASELEVSKYMADLIGYNWKKSGGVFTFGGKGTNLYATKIALNKANNKCSLNGIGNKEYFMLTTETSHPCHYQVCDWIGIGKNNCYEVPCDINGVIDLEKMKQIIKKNLDAGKIFLGINLNGGNTNELVIDPVKEVSDYINIITKEYQLSYKPHIHVDSVIGWIYLFFNNYDFKNNALNIEENVLKKIKKINKLVKKFKYADSLGIDFHKTGFCPYSSSLFLLKDRKEFSVISSKNIPSLQSLEYGNYNPYDYTLELSRGSNGPIAALTSLKTIGIKGFQTYLVNILTASNNFRKELKKLDNIYLLNDESAGFATLFIIIPKKYNIKKLDEILNLNNEQISEIMKYNISFSGYLLNLVLNNEIDFYFTSSRSYVIPNTNIKIGALKAYPTSVYYTEAEVKRFIKKLKQVITMYENEKKIINIQGIKDDMVYENK